MSRYIERAEHTARLIAVKLESMVEQTPEDAAASWARVVEALTGEKTAPLHLDAFAITRKLAFDSDNDNSLITSLALAREADAAKAAAATATAAAPRRRGQGMRPAMLPRRPSR